MAELRLTPAAMNDLENIKAVSYTHLDVYKRQIYSSIAQLAEQTSTKAPGRKQSKKSNFGFRNSEIGFFCY